MMKKLEWLITASMIGAGAVYFLDPKAGRQRQSMVKDKLSKFASEKREAVDVMVKDFSNRSKGVIHDVHEKFEEVAVKPESDELSSQSHWTPAASLIVGSAGAYLTLKGLWKRHMWGGILVSIGLGMIMKSFAETESQMQSLTPEAFEPDDDQDMHEPKATRKAKSQQASLQ